MRLGSLQWLTDSLFDSSYKLSSISLLCETIQCNLNYIWQSLNSVIADRQLQKISTSVKLQHLISVGHELLYMNSSKYFLVNNKCLLLKIISIPPIGSRNYETILVSLCFKHLTLKILWLYQYGVQSN